MYWVGLCELRGYVKVGLDECTLFWLRSPNLRMKYNISVPTAKLTDFHLLCYPLLQLPYFPRELPMDLQANVVFAKRILTGSKRFVVWGPAAVAVGKRIA